MRRFAFVAVVLGLIGGARASIDWSSSRLFVDSAPQNPAAYASWFTDVSNYYSSGGTQDFRHGAFPNTTNFSANDAIYNTATGTGRGLVWIFWLPNALKADLTADNALIEAQTTFDWGGAPQVLPWGSPIIYDVTEIGGGVMGFFWDGFDVSVQSPPYDAVAGLASAMNTNQTYWRGAFRQVDAAGHPVGYLSKDAMLAVPLPTALPAGLGLLGVLFVSRRISARNKR